MVGKMNRLAVSCVLALFIVTAFARTNYAGNEGAMALLTDFLSSYSCAEKVVAISVEPQTVYIEDGREAQNLNFDFALEGLTDRELLISFIKVGVYDETGNLLTFRYLNHNAVETPGIYTIGKYVISGKEKFDIYNPFPAFSKKFKIGYLRYMFTFLDTKTKQEFYYGNIIVKPAVYKQRVKLSLPLKGLLTVLDGHDFYSHHRRFGMTVIRKATNNTMQENFSRYALDLGLIGPDGNLYADSRGNNANYDFHFSDIRKSYTNGATVYSPADGEVVDIVDNLDDLYDKPFDFDKALAENRIRDTAGNFIIIKHNDAEFSHLFHLEKGSVKVRPGQKVRRGQELARVGFSGTATVYSHLHYQLLNGKDFLKDDPLPFKFSDINIMVGSDKQHYKAATLDTGDLISNY